MKDKLILNTKGEPSFLNKFGYQKIEVYEDIENLTKKIQFLEAENEALKRENDILKTKWRKGKIDERYLFEKNRTGLPWYKSSGYKSI